MLNNLLDDLIQKPQKSGGVVAPDGLLDDLISTDTVTPPQGQALAPPAVAVNSGLGGGAAPRTVSGFQLPPVMDPFGINKPTQAIPQQTFKAGTPGFSVMGDLPAPTPVPKGVTQEFVTGVRNELLRATPQQRVQLAQADGMKGRVAQSLLESEPATFRRREDTIQETPLATQIGMDLRSNVQNPVARGVIGGLAGLGQVLPGAIEAGANLVGADGVARVAAGAAQVGRDISEPLRPAGGNERLAFDIFNSITQSAPTLLVGLAGGPAMTTLFAQSGAQQYSEGRSRGLSGPDAAMRAGIQAGAEVLGERFGFGEQIKILRGLAAGLPADELAPVLARQIIKEVPGEQLTTLVQFLGDKYGPGALNPEGTLAQYLSQAGETLKVTIGQAGVMSGGPTVIAGARDTMRSQEASQLAGATDALPASTLAARIPAPSPVSERIEPTMDGLLDDLIPKGAPDATAPQAPTIPAVGKAPDAPGPTGVPAGSPIAATQPDESAAPAEPQPSAALTPTTADSSLRFQGLTEDEYIARINPTGEVRQFDEPMPASLFRQLPTDGQLLGTTKTRRGDEIRFVSGQETPGSVLAVMNGEVVGYVAPEGGTTGLFVAEEMRGQGIGEALSTFYRTRNPFAPSGGMSPDGERIARKVFRTLAQQSASALVGNESQQPAATPTDTQRVSTVTGRQVETRMRVVDASELQAASGELQPRDRTRASSDEQINAIAGQLDPQRLGESAEADRGAPIIGPDMIVESGNGRVMAIRRAFEMFPERAQAYRDYLAAQGYDTTGLAMPVLVRERVTPMTQQERVAFVQEANQSATMALSPVEMAQIDVSAMVPSVVEVWRGGQVADAANRDFVRAFIGQLPQAQRNSLMDADGLLSPDGARRIERALLAAAYEDRDLLNTLIDSQDNNIRSIGGALLDSAGQWLQMRGLARDGVIDAGYDLTADLVEAARVVNQLREQGSKVREWLAQSDLMSERNPNVDAFVTAFYNQDLTRAVGRDAINDVLRDYVAMASSQDTAGLFGDAPPAPTDMVKGAVEQRNERNKETVSGNLFDRAEPQGDADAGQGTQPRGRQAKPAVVQGSRAQPDGGRAKGPILDASDRGPAARKGPQGSADPAQAGNVNERARRSNRDDASAGTQGSERGRQDDEANQNQRVKGTGSGSVFRKVSFTDRQSIYRDAFVELGFDPAEAELLPPQRQYEILSKGLKTTYGLTFVQKSDRANIRDSIDQLLDAYRGLQLMTHVLDLPTSAIGLRGTLGLAVTSQGKYLGAYYPGGTGGGQSADGVKSDTPTIAMPGRSNSFAHEWGHALDYFVLTNYEGVVSDLSGYIRKGESLSDKTPETVRDSFRLLMNSLFFDQAEQSAKIMDLEQRIEAAAQRGVDATKLKADLERIKSGASMSRSDRSEFFKAAGDFGKATGSDPDYWRMPTEMLARSFEAYVAHKVEAAGGSTEFIGKSDAAYSSEADLRLAKTFPKNADRYNIFRAYDLLFDAIRAEALLNPNNEAVANLPGNVRLSDPAVYFDDQRQSAQTPAYKQAWEAEKRAWAVRGRELEKLKSRPADGRPLMKRMGDAVRSFIETNRGVLLGMEGHYKRSGNNAAANAIRAVTERLATDPGSGRKTAEGGTYAESVDRETKRFLTRLSNIRGNNNADLMSDADLAQLTNVLTAMGTEASASAGTTVNKLAAQLREMLTDLYYYNRNAGLDIGFVKDQGYLPRLLDEPLVTANAAEFVRDATMVYQLVFERDTERPSDADDVVVALAALDKRIKEAGLSKDDPSLEAYMEAKKELAKLQRKLDAANRSEDSDQIDSAQADVREFLDASMSIFEEAYDYVRDQWTSQAAAEYQTRISYGSPESFSSHSPAGAYLKERTLPPEADKILAKYYIQDPLERITSYVQMSVRKAEYNTRFGRDTRNSREKQTKLYEMLDAMVRSGVRKEDRDMVEKIVGQVTGTDRSSMPHQAQRLLGNVHAIGQMALLGRVVLTSLAEPITVALQTGKPLDALKAVGLTMQEIANTGSVRERRAMARVLGIVSGDYADEMISNRLGGSFAESSAMSRVTANYFRRVGLTGLTNAQRRAAMQLSGRYVLELTHTLDDAKASERDKGFARAELLDAGIQPEQIQDFINWSREFSDRMPRHDELIDVDGSLTEMGKIYSVMVGRLVNQSIQNPTAIDRPWAANTPVGRLTYGLLSFSMAFFRNVMVKSAKKVAREYEQRGAGQAAAVAGMQVLAPLASLYMGHLLVTVAREALLNPDKWEEEEKKEDGFPIKWLSSLAFSRVGFTGLADPLYNALLGVKYQRDLVGILAGPSNSFFGQSLERIVKYFVANSENTNSAERAAARGLYELAVQPAFAYATGYLPGGPMVGYGLGASYMYFSSPAFKSQWQDWMAGEKEGKQKKTGSGQKESPL
jgi:hypothetical protein